jgi:hypothetical protein
MGKIIRIIIGIMFLYTYSYAQENQAESMPKADSQPQQNTVLPELPKMNITDGYDRIIKLNKDTLVVSIQKITKNEIVYIYPFNTVINRIPVYHIKDIISKDGYTNPTFKFINGTGKQVKKDTLAISDYKSIEVTYNQAEVEGLTDLGAIESFSEGEKATSNTSIMEKNAIFQLRKKAAQLGATKILITDKSVETPYGENPMVELKGIAYK